jgi:curli biogenesis system outer membrane secretion channel CsgG
LNVFGGSAESVTARVTVDIRLVDAVTAEVIAIGIGTSQVSQGSIEVDVLNIIRALQAGRSGTTIIDIAVRNAIRGAINEAATSLPQKQPTG